MFETKDLRQTKGHVILKKFPQYVCSTLGVLGLVLGVWGYLYQAGTLFWPWAQIDDLHAAFIQTLQLFVLNVGPDAMPNATVKWASILAPLATAAAIGSALLNFLGHDWRITHVHLFTSKWVCNFFDPYCGIVLGGGANATAIIRKLAASDVAKKVIVVCPAADAPLSQALAEQTLAFGENITGFQVITDLHNAEGLRKLYIHKIKRIWVATDNTEENLRLQKMLVNELGCKQDMVVFADDAALVEMYQKQHTLPQSQCEYVNLLGLTARQLLLNHPPVYPLLSEQSSTVHLCIVGAHPLCEVLLVDAIRHCVYADSPERSVRITLIGVQANAMLQKIYERHPVLKPEAQAGSMANLLPLAYIKTIDCIPTNLQPDTWSHAQQSISQGGMGDFSKIYICESTDTMTHLVSKRIVALQDVCNAKTKTVDILVACVTASGQNVNKITYKIPKEKTETAEKQETPEEKTETVTVTLYPEFDLDDKWWDITNDSYPGKSTDLIAASVDEAYSSQSDQIKIVDEKILNKFSEEKLWRKWSSRCSADHIKVKHSLLNSHMERDLQVEELNKIEHRRFLAERLVDNWLYLNKSFYKSIKPPSNLPYLPQKNELHLNNTLIPYDDLPEEEKNKDKRIVIRAENFNK